MESKRSNRIIFLSFVLMMIRLVGPVLFTQSFDETRQGMVEEEIHLGVILNMGSRESKIVHNCISMAISDFYSVHGYYKTRVIFHTRDSKGEPLRALTSALDLLENSEVRAIIGAQTSMEAKFLAELGNKTKVPVISFSAPTGTSSPSNKYPYFFQINQDESSVATGIADIVRAFKWKDVVIIHEENDDWRDFIPHLVDLLQEKDIHISYKSSLDVSLDDSNIIEEIQKLMASEQKVFVVHMSPLLTFRFYMNAKNLGMMREGYAWIMTVKSMDYLHSNMGSSVTESMQGVIGLKSYIPASKELYNFTSRWRNTFSAEHNMEIKDLNVFCIRAYDVAWALAKAAERVRPKICSRRNADDRLSLNLMDLDNITTSTHGSILVEEILKLKSKGLSGEFRFVNGKLVSNAFEIVNVIGRSGDRRVGFWTSVGKITRELYSSSHGRQLYSNSTDLEDIIWPGGSAKIPKGHVMQMSSKKLRIGVVRNSGFPELVNIHQNLETNITTITGFCIDVFRAAIEQLPYQVEYELIPFPDRDRSKATIDLFKQLNFQNYDAVVADTTVTAERSLYVDFTSPYTDLGVGMVAPKAGKNGVWIFLEPLTCDLWLTSAAFFVLTGFVIWLIEHPINNEFQGPISQQIGMIFWFAFSTLVFAHREKLLSNLSRFVVIVWLFIVLILTSSYTATLTSMMTVQHIELNVLNSKDNYIGYQDGSIVSKGVISNLNFKNSNLRPFNSPEEYANALSRGSKKGGVSAIIDEVPYLKIFLAKYSKDYSMTGPISPSTNGFGFVFPKGSPLVADISRAIAKLREDGKLAMMEYTWFQSQSMLTSSGDNSNNLKPLTTESFRGLFLISGVTSALALVMLYSFLIHKNWHVLKHCDFKDFFQSPLNFVKEYLSKKLFSRTEETNVIHPEHTTP
ncbi:hypothetical protein Ddye_017695 [Dipteronia dyeriana]|uniref:Glutamate receptor n=1 Tax=Dipteronia dyeriana TaxID=168575 RepID=A0AAD9X0R9_9ROSI|nr:hypothetical protein Ddye_017695 [Dipteronia dyeriana]